MWLSWEWWVREEKADYLRKEIKERAESKRRRESGITEAASLIYHHVTNHLQPSGLTQQWFNILTILWVDLVVFCSCLCSLVQSVDGLAMTEGTGLRWPHSHVWGLGAGCWLGLSLHVVCHHWLASLVLHLSAVWPGASYITFPGLNVCICNVMIAISFV